MATVIHNTNKACCTIKPVLDDDYQGKGEFKPIAGYKKAYVVGEKTSNKVIIVAYDAFGYLPQTLQGADIVAESSKALVILPDFFDGDPANPDWFFKDADSPESKASLQKWFGTVGNFAAHVAGYHEVADALREENKDVKIGSIGYCWGGKLVTIGGTDASKFDAIVSVHPGEMDRNDAQALVVPIALFPSSGEDAKECEAFMEIVKEKPFGSKCQYKYYSTVHHGWAGGRANLKDEENLKQYKDVFERISHFFNTVL